MAQSSNRFFYWDKGSFPNRRSTHTHILGECQSSFNVSMVMDGTKDSMKVQVLSFIDAPVEPMTIVYHMGTDTYWVIADDKIERYEHEGQPYYMHNLQLLGAIELLNARDLTDCGFNANRYTIQSFITRLFRLSNFELLYGSNVLLLNVVGNAIDLNQKVDYVKTFENYTLLSALREFLDGYNCCAKLKFTTIVRPARNIVQLDIYSKTGNTSRTHEMSEFKDVREIKTMDKDSFGTIVVSNAQNVVSTKAKIFPLIGGVNLSSTTYEIKNDSEETCIRLPTPAYKVNWVKMLNKKLHITVNYGSLTYDVYCDTSNKLSMEECYDEVGTKINAISQQEYNNFKTRYPDYESFMEEVVNQTSATFYDDNIQYNIHIQDTGGPGGGSVGDLDDDPDGLFYSPSGKPLLKFLAFSTSKYWVLGKKALHDGVNFPYQVMYWESGSDLIKGFTYFSKNNYTSFFGGIIRFKADRVIYFYNNNGVNVKVAPPTGAFSGNGTYFAFRQIAFQVNYIPMADIKIKMANNKDSRDIQFYNQTGKLTDSNALSKLLLSYSKEIESTTITKYGTYYSYSSTPKVGDIVYDNNVQYVINNVSYDFQQNDGYEYIIYGEFTMSQYVATKSLMVNPQTNIRDYNIPQNYNVKRKQVYKDYWELSFTQNNDNNYYCILTEYLHFSRKRKMDQHSSIIYTEYSTGDYYWYQLDTTQIALKKSVYEIVDFKDNNIIGYSTCNTRTGFDVSRLFNNLTIVNTPVSYVDENGEIITILLYFVNADQLETFWQTYALDNDLDPTISIYNYSIIVPEEIGENAQDNYIYTIQENQYNKDATEVPVFEYACELGDTNDIIVGENIFFEDDKQYGNSYFGFIAVPKNVATNNNWTQFIDLDEIRTNIVDYSELDNAVRIAATISPTEKYYRFMFYEDIINDTYEGSYTNMADIFNPETQDLIIYKCYIDNNEDIYAELIFIVKDAPQDNIIPATEYMPMHLKVFINHIPKKGI